MQNTFLLAYHLAAYSLGLATLISSFAMIKKSADAGWFFACTLSMTLTVLFSTFLNFVDLPSGSWIHSAIVMANYLMAAAFPVALVRFFDTVYPWRLSKAADASVPFIFAVLYLLVALDTATKRLEWSYDALLIAKNLACLYATALGVSGHRRRIANRFGAFSWRISLASALFLPFMILTEIPVFNSLFLPLIGSIDIEGPWLLPGIYIIWCLTFLLPSVDRSRAPAIHDPSLGDYASDLGLSRREKEVMDLLIVGKSYKEIMATLSISMPTVKTHVSNLYRKTGASNRLDLARRTGALAHPKG